MNFEKVFSSYRTIVMLDHLGSPFMFSTLRPMCGAKPPWDSVNFEVSNNIIATKKISKTFLLSVSTFLSSRAENSLFSLQDQMKTRLTLNCRLALTVLNHRARPGRFLGGGNQFGVILI